MPDNDTITIELDYSPDAVHAPAWERVLETSPDAETARADLAELVAETADIDSCVYQLYREREAQQQRAAEQLFGGDVKMGPPDGEPGGGGE